MKTDAPNQPRRTEREIFLEAIEIDDPTVRSAFLKEACAADSRLLDSVETLIQNHQHDEFMQTPVLPKAAADRPGTAGHRIEVAGEKIGDRLGPYKLLQKIGEGGVGIVYLAEQEEPIRRRVAIKVLRPGVESKSVIARFESESQALALMDHPNIARVIDAGTTAVGKPYFVMDLVRGARITDYCDENQLTTRERLELFLKVCQAVQHAHQKGIIHRDIKPSNILVTLHDGQPVPKVIDFGIAKATEQKLTDKTVLTEFHSFIGTPAYISPEQAEMSGLDIDTRADIYSLGVLLYELLTGRTPFDAKELIASGLDGMRRTIREVEPMRPSTTVKTMLAAERTKTAGRQRLEPSTLAGLLQGDLDWIILKALEKDRTRRYETANALAMDLQRYLDNQPVIARPPSTAYRVAKFVRRNKMASTAVVAFAVALAIGLGFTTWQWIEKSEAYRRVAQSEQSEIRLKVEAVEAREAAEVKAAEARRNAYAADMNLAQQALAVNNLGRARELLARYLPDKDAAHREEPDLRGWEWRYLWEHCRSDALFNLNQASNSVSSLSVSSDGHWVAAGGYMNAGISVWDLRSRREVVRFPPREVREPFQFSPTAPLLAMAGSADGSQPSAITERPRHSVRLWDGETRRFTAELALDANCKALQFSADGSRLVAVADDLSMTIWEVASGRVLERRQLRGVVSPSDLATFRHGVVSKDLRFYAHAVERRKVQVIELASGEELWSAEAADENIQALALSPDGSLLATSGGFVESVVRLWDVAGGTELAQLQAHRTYVRNLVFWPDGRRLASASGDQTIHVWDVSRVGELAGTIAARDARPRFWRSLTITQPAATLRGHQDEVWSLALAPDTHTLVSGGKDGWISVWETAAGAVRRELLTLPVAVKNWSFTPDSQSILVFDEDHRLARWHGARFQERTPIFEFNTNVTSILISPDGELVAANRSDRVVEVLNLTQCTLQQQIGSPDDPHVPVAFLASGNELVTGQLRTGAYHKWDLATGGRQDSWQPGVTAGMKTAYISPGGQWSLHPGREGVGLLWNTFSKQGTSLDVDLRQISQAVFSPDERLLAVVSWLGFAQVWEAESARHVATLRGFLQGQHSAAFSPNGDRLAIGSNAREAVKVWDVNGFQELLTLEGSGSMFMSVAFSPDGNVLAAGNSKGRLHLWQAPALEEIEPAISGR